MKLRLNRMLEEAIERATRDTERKLRLWGYLDDETEPDPPKLAAAKRALAAVKASGRVPSYRNIETESIRLGQKVTRATIKKYHTQGLLKF